MTRDETKELIMAMEVAYPNFHPADKTYTVNVWTSMLSDYDFGLIQIAFKRFVLTDTSGFAPTIGQIINQVQAVAAGDDMGELAAWTLVKRAIENALYHADEEFAALPPVLQRAVYSPGNLREWAMMDTDTVNSVIQSHVIRCYRAALKSERENGKLPQAFREQIAAQREVKTIEVEKPTEPAEKIPENRRSGTDHSEMIDLLRVKLHGTKL